MLTDKNISLLKKRLTEPLPGLEAQVKMASKSRFIPEQVPDTARASAVLGLLFPKEKELNILLIKRVEDGKVHGGQISFPGGRRDPEDKDLQQTALRETWEEVGIPSGNIEIVGKLSPLYISVSNSHVHPYIGFMDQAGDYAISKDEVQYTIEAPIERLFHESIKTRKKIRPSAYPELVIDTPVYQWDEDITIWGATAMILSELEQVIRSL